MKILYNYDNIQKLSHATLLECRIKSKCRGFFLKENFFLPLIVWSSEQLTNLSSDNNLSPFTGPLCASYTLRDDFLHSINAFSPLSKLHTLIELSELPEQSSPVGKSCKQRTAPECPFNVFKHDPLIKPQILIVKSEEPLKMTWFFYISINRNIYFKYQTLLVFHN